MTSNISPPNFPSCGFVRCAGVIKPNGPIPVSRSSLYVMVREGRFPAPLKLSSKITAWRVQDILDYIAAPENWVA